MTSVAQDRFPKPEFETDYQQPLTTTPEPRSQAWEYVDVLLLVTALSLASYFALKTRSRRSIFILMIFSLAYFGFIRRGCVCSVGATQNMVLALADPSYLLPAAVVAFFILPLIFTLFFGRTFCAAVCPLGAVQDIISYRQTKLPAWLSHVLDLLPYLYLGLAVLFAATGSAFIICQYDPFVSIFRLSGNFTLILISGVFLVMSIFVARPYCRFLCPYGVLLGWMSRLARRHVTITPDDCVQCRLCEDVCPVDAILKPTPEKAPETRAKGTKRLAIMLILLPAMIIAGGWAVSRLDGILSRVHPRVRLAEQILKEDAGIVRETTVESRTYRSQGKTVEDLVQEAMIIKKDYQKGGWYLGGFLGLVFFGKLYGLSVRRKRTDYVPDRSSCLSCGRCFLYCPKERVRLKNKTEEQ